MSNTSDDVNLGGKASGLVLHSTITCPECGFKSRDVMPANACQWFYDCKGCGATLKPKHGDCCVYCSYGDVKCPPMQTGEGCGA